MQKKLIFGLLTALLLTPPINGHASNLHENGCKYEKANSEKEAKKHLAMVVKTGIDFKKKGASSKAKACLEVAEKYMKEIPGDKKEKAEAMKEVKKALS